MEPFGLPNPHYTNFGAPWARNWCPQKGIAKKRAFSRIFRTHVAGPAECAGAVGVRGLLKTAYIEVNGAVGLARPCSPFGGAADYLIAPRSPLDPYPILCMVVF